MLNFLVSIVCVLFEEGFKILQDVSRSVLVRVLDLVFNPPVSIIDFSSVIYGVGSVQACFEYIDIDFLRDRSVASLFILLDEVLSIIPEHEVKSIRSMYFSGEVDDVFDRVCKLCENFIKDLRTFQGFSECFLKYEDSMKTSILMILPGERQFRNVREDPNRWLWKKVTRNGDVTPTFDGWFREFLNICDVLVKEGLKVYLFVDESEYENVRSILSSPRINVYSIDIPPHLPKIGYSRDQSITITSRPILCNMVLNLRRGEEDVVKEIYYRLGIAPLFRPRWYIIDNVIVRAHIEGGNIFLIKTDRGVLLLSGSGIRGTNEAAVKVLDEVLPDYIRIVLIPIVSYIRDWEKGAVHLDVAFTYLGNVGGTYLCLIDPSRASIYSTIEFDRNKKQFKLIELLKIFKELDIYIDEPEKNSTYSYSTMLNYLNLGNGKLIGDSYNRSINRYIEKTYGVDIIEIDIPHIEAGGGGIRCVTRELWP